MDLRRLGITGLEVSELALGAMQFGWTADEAASFAIMDAYAGAGGNLIDTANIYSKWVEGYSGGESETIVGRWMKRRKNRQDIVLATKVRGRMWDGPNGEGLGRVHIMRAVEGSLRRLQTDSIDLYQTHWPDNDTPIEEKLRTFDDLISSGKVRYIGCSNISAWQLVESMWAGDKHGLHSYVSVQPHYNLVHRAEFERELADVVKAYGIGVINYSPLAGGFLSGKYGRNKTPPDSARLNQIRQRYFSDFYLDLLDRIHEIATAHGKSVLKISLAWLLSNPLITAPIIGASKVEQIEESLSPAGIRLSDNEMDQLNQASDWRDSK